MGLVAKTLLILLASAGAACPQAAEVDRPPPRSSELPLPRDPDIAVQEELDLARRRGTVEGYDHFLARHGDHRLARTARRERAELAARARRRPPKNG